MKEQSARIGEERYHEANVTIQLQFRGLPIVRKAQTVMCYYSVNREVETHSMIRELLEAGKTVALPKCMPDRRMAAVRIRNLEELIPARFGLMEPPDAAAGIGAEQFDLLVIPGMAFDRAGRRLGHGAGYYDRFLHKSCGWKVGLGYDWQVVDELPEDPWDVKLDALLTSSGFVAF